MRVWIALLLVTTVLAGCSDSGEDVVIPTSAECLEQGLILDPEQGTCVEPPFVMREFEDPSHDCVIQQDRDRVHAPDLVGNPWVLGQWWDYSLQIDGMDMGTTKLVYYDDQDFSGEVAQHYMVGTPTREEALHHALFSHNPMIGRVHRVLYSPHESGDHADMFNFPLCQGSSWTTTFYGESFTLTASTANITVPGRGTSPGFAIQGTSAEGGTLRLSYSPVAQWFTYIDLDAGSGLEVDLALTAVGTGYQGDAFFLRGQKDEMVSLTSGSLVANAAPFVESRTVVREDGGDGPYDTIALHVMFMMAGDGVAELSIADPDDNAVYTHQVTPQGGEPFVSHVFEVPYAAGDWSVTLEGVAVSAGAASVAAHVKFVSIYDRSGSV